MSRARMLRAARVRSVRRVVVSMARHLGISPHRISTYRMPTTKYSLARGAYLDSLRRLQEFEAQTAQVRCLLAAQFAALVEKSGLLVKVSRAEDIE